MMTTIQVQAIKTCERLSCHEIAEDDAECLQQEEFAHGKEDGYMATWSSPIRNLWEPDILTVSSVQLPRAKARWRPWMVALKKSSFKVRR